MKSESDKYTVIQDMERLVSITDDEVDHTMKKHVISRLGNRLIVREYFSAGDIQQHRESQAGHLSWPGIELSIKGLYWFQQKVQHKEFL